VPIVSLGLVTYVESLYPSKQKSTIKKKTINESRRGLWERKAPWISSRNKANIEER
jgi:hypothetical protein